MDQDKLPKAELRIEDAQEYITEHIDMLRVRTARIITPKGYEPMEIVTHWQDGRTSGDSRVCRSRGFVTKNRKYVASDNEWETGSKHDTFTFSPDAQLTAYLEESRELGGYRDLIRIVDTKSNRHILSIALQDDEELHDKLFVSGPYSQMKFSKNNRKLLYFARPNEYQYITNNDIPRRFVICIYDFDTDKVSLALDETICTKFVHMVEWTPDDRGIVYLRDDRIYFHQFLNNRHFELTDCCHNVAKITFSPDGTRLAVFLNPWEFEFRSILLFNWPLTSSASPFTNHNVITLRPFKIFSIPERPWANGGKQLLFNASFHTDVRVCALDMTTFTVQSLPFSRSGTIIDVRDDEILLETASVNNYSRLWISSISTEAVKEPTGSEIASCLVVQKNVMGGCQEFTVAERFFDRGSYSAVFFYISQAKYSNRPLVVVPWTGPETHFTLNHRDPIVATFVNYGYCVLVVNYRKPYMELLPNMGFPTLFHTGYVDDTHNAVMQILAEFPDLIDKTKVNLYGHKYGAFIAASMIRDFEDSYHRCVLVRPLLKYHRTFPDNQVDREMEPHLYGKDMTTPILMIIETSYREFEYQAFESDLKSANVYFKKLIADKWRDDQIIQHVLQFYQDPMNNEN